MFTPNELKKIKLLYQKELLENVIPFWERYSLDPVNGGYFNCLDRNGEIYDRRKNIWLVARQAWMFSTLYRKLELRAKWLEIAQSGIKFLQDYAIRKDRRVYFALTEDGKPMQLQRKLFSESFYAMALAEYGHATGEKKYLEEAKLELEKLFEWAQFPEKLGKARFDGEPPSISLAVPMILLNLLEVIGGDNLEKYEPEARDCIKQILLHVHEDQRIVYETVGQDGAILDTIEGRLLNPGHTLETSWILQHWAIHFSDATLSNLAANIGRWSFERGWDQEQGGIFYFLDAKGFSPTQLEWSMKLWWPHAEALYANLLNAYLFENKADWEAFQLTHQYTFSHFPDSHYGEWFGYLDRSGTATHQFKGGPYKGCFHVPRSLLYCLELFSKM